MKSQEEEINPNIYVKLYSIYEAIKGNKYEVMSNNTNFVLSWRNHEGYVTG